MYDTIPFILLLVTIKFLYGYWNKDQKNLSKKKRVVRFRPVVEGNKFQRRESQSSEFIENAVKQNLSSTDSDENIKLDPINGVNKDFAFFIRNVLTKKECEALIKAAESTGFEQRKYSGKGDDSSSCCFQSNQLSNKVIFDRIKQLLPQKSYFDADCMYTHNIYKYIVYLNL